MAKHSSSRTPKSNIWREQQLDLLHRNMRPQLQTMVRGCEFATKDSKLVLHSLKQRTWKWNQTATFLAQGLPPPKPWLRPHTPITCNSCGLLGYLHQYYPNCSRIGAKNELMGSNSLRIIVWPQMLWESPLWSLRSRHQSNSVERIQEPEGRSQTPRW